MIDKVDEQVVPNDWYPNRGSALLSLVCPHYETLNPTMKICLCGHAQNFLYNATSNMLHNCTLSWSNAPTHQLNKPECSRNPVIITHKVTAIPFVMHGSDKLSSIPTKFISSRLWEEKITILCSDILADCRIEIFRSLGHISELTGLSMGHPTI